MTRLARADVVMAVALAAIVAALSWQRSGLLHPVLYQYRAGALETSDIWFDADIPKMSCLMSDRTAVQHVITSEHPLISTVSYGPALVIGGVAGAGGITRIRAVVALHSAAWIVALFGALRLRGCRRFDAAAFSLLGATTAAAVFWMAVPESFLPGAITLMAPIALVALPTAGGRFGERAYTAASAVSLSVTVTNWSSGLAAVALSWPWRRALQISANALVAVSALWFLQSWWFPENGYFLGSGRVLELLHNVERPRISQVLTVLFSHAIVMPGIGVRSEELWRGLTIQASLPGSSGAAGIVATVLWMATLALGAVQLFRMPALRSYGAVLLIAIGAQVLVHSLIGKETFLYVMHVATLLILVAAAGALGPQRRVAVALAIVLAATAGANNWHQFERARSVVDEIGRQAAGSGAVFQVATECH